MPGTSYEALEARFFANLGGGEFRAYRDDPVAFAKDILGLDLWEKQAEGVDAVRSRDRFCERSGHGIGKTLQVSCIVLWAVYALRWLVLSTAPTFRQVESVLWRQIHKLYYGSRKQLSGELLHTQLKTSDAMALGLSTNEPGRFQGYHDAEGILVVEDEAPGVPPSIHEAIEGVLSGGGKWVKIGNPTSPSGPFYDCFRSPNWHTMAVSCWEHPNVVEDKIIIPGAVTRQWCEDRKAEWGEESPLYQSRVLGQFPDEGEDTLIRLSWAEGAFHGNDILDCGLGERSDDVNASADRVIVCDVARYGQDETVIGMRDGSVYTELERYTGKDLMQTTGHIVQFFNDYDATTIIVDDSGLGGGVTDRLEEQGLPVMPFNGGEAADDPERYINRRAQAWWEMREALRKGEITIAAKDPDGLKYQLTALRYKIESKGRVKIEAKDDAKKRGVKSPDRADALAMTFGGTAAPLWVM